MFVQVCAFWLETSLFGGLETKQFEVSRHTGRQIERKLGNLKPFERDLKPEFMPLKAEGAPSIDLSYWK